MVAQSVEDAQIAEEAGADRLELVSALSLGGLTPSIGTLEAVLSTCKLPTMAMLRPRSGGFAYAPGELDAMERDGERFLSAGARGLVFGVLDVDGIHERANLRLVALGGEATFHRAFDTLPNPLEVLERIIDLGFRRVLTSGGRDTASEGAETIRQLVDRADGRIEIVAGGRVRPSNVAELIERTRVRQVHLGAVRWIDDPTGGMAFNSAHPEASYGRVDGTILKAVRNIALQLS